MRDFMSNDRLQVGPFRHPERRLHESGAHLLLLALSGKGIIPKFLISISGRIIPSVTMNDEFEPRSINCCLNVSCYRLKEVPDVPFDKAAVVGEVRCIDSLVTSTAYRRRGISLDG